MENVKIEPFKVIGIAVRTTNQDGQAGHDIQALWQKFMEQGIQEKIPNKVSNDILSIYTNYEGDYMQPYDTILGCKVSDLTDIPDGMVGQSFDGGNYAKFLTKGDLTKGIVYNAWVDIWSKPLARNYAADFEVYDQRSQNPNDAEVDIFLGLK